MIHGQEESKEILEQLERHDAELSDWERQFVDSVTRQVDEGRELSTKQRKVIGDIWDKVG